MTVARDVRRFGAEDLSALVALRREALEADPTAFGASLDDDRGLDPDFVRSVLTNADEEAIFGYFDGEDWAGSLRTGRGLGIHGSINRWEIRQFVLTAHGRPI